MLFAIIEDEDAYLIDVRTHDNFADTDLLEVADRNWPDIFQFLPVIPGSNFTAEQICNLRANNVGYAVNVNGRALMPKNIATCAGGSLRVTRWMHQIRGLLAVHQAQLYAPLSEIRCRIATVLGVAEERLNLEFVDHDDNFDEFILLKDSQTDLGIRYKFR